MAYVTFEPLAQEIISVPYWFITDFMPQALGGYVKLYLYLLAQKQNSLSAINLEETAKQLEMLHQELLLGLQYWHDKKVISFSSTSSDTFSLTFFLSKPDDTVAVDTSQQNSNTNKVHLQQTRPHYTKDELLLYKKQHQSISNLFRIAEEYLGRMLSSTDQQVLFGLYDWLNMPLDLIEYLIEYCVSNGHKKIRYIETVALGWVDAGITSVEAAKMQTTVTKQYRQILKALGRSGETITKHERELLTTWLKKFSLELILEACKRTVLQASSPSLNYLGSILENWAKNNVTSISDIDNLDKAHSKKTPPARTSAPKNTNFTTMYSHNWDLDELENNANDYMKQTLLGGKS
ncbi:MAG: DnaD domain protein [Cellulosilyticaceae bacterium]